MMRPLACAFLWLCPFLLYGQTPAASAQPNGLQPDWDIGRILQEIGAHAARLLPALNQIDAKAWVEQGASETYAVQLQSSREQAKALADGAQVLARNPEKLSACMELYFRIQGLEQMIGSLVEGIRKYQDVATADKLVSLSAENGTNRGRFQTYIINLASQREQECAVMDREAQRCRGMLFTQAPPPAKSTAKRKK
jgi:hypothetical protein